VFLHLFILFYVSTITCCVADVLAGDTVPTHMERYSEWSSLFVRSGACGSVRDTVDIQHPRLSVRAVIQSTTHSHQSQRRTGSIQVYSLQLMVFDCLNCWNRLVSCLRENVISKN